MEASDMDLQELCREYCEVSSEISALQKRKRAARDAIAGAVRGSVDVGPYRVSVTPPSEAWSVRADLLEKCYPDVYRDVRRSTYRSASIRVTRRKE